MEFGVLGPLLVHSPSGVVQVRRGLPRVLLLTLLVRRGQTVASDLLIDVLWGDEQPKNPSNALQIQVSYLRKTFLDEGGLSGTSILETRAGGYAIAIPAEQVDAERFDALTKGFQPMETLSGRASLVAALREVDEGLELWRGEAYEEISELEIARGESARLEERRWNVLERRNDLLLVLGRHSELVGEVTAQIGQAPLRERLHEQLALALYRSGRQAEALRAIEAARRQLAEQIGVDPGPSLKELERQILVQDAGLEWQALPSESIRVQPVAVATPVAPDTPLAGAGRLPVPLSPLIGREDDLARLGPQLGVHRILTLTGPAGAGKSRLAVALAGEQTCSTTYIDLGPLEDAALVGPTLAAALGITVAPGADSSVAVGEALAGQEALIVLDTCEHLVAAAAQVAATILKLAPNVRILATSRRALGLPGELAWPVPPLSLPPDGASTVAEISDHGAVALFLDRATSVRPDLNVDDPTAKEIAALCLELDGLPLAIELAAARADVLSPAAIRSRLKDRFDLLVDGGPAASARQQTLRGAVAWSFDLLTADQQVFFARLGCFAGSFDLDAALAVAGDGLGTPLELFSALVRQSMISRAGTERFRLLDTLRAYATEVLYSMDADDSRRRHAAYYVALAEQGEPEVRGAEQIVWLDRLRSDINNFRAAIDWCLSTGDITGAARLAGALAWFWTLNGTLGEAVGHLERLIELDTVAPATRARCLWGFALLAASIGRLDDARRAGYLAADLSGSVEPVGRAYGLNAAAVAEWALGNHETSLAVHEEAISLLRTADDAWGLAICTVLRARTLFDLGRGEADAVAHEGVALSRRAGDVHVLGIALTQIADAAIASGSYAAAVEAAGEALYLQEQIGYTEGIISALHVLGQAHRRNGHDEIARSLHHRALRLAARIGHAAATCEAMEDLARTEAATNPDRASALLQAAREERVLRNIPLRPRDDQELQSLAGSLPAATPGSERSFHSVLMELIG